MDKGCSQHDIAYGKYKDLEKRTQSDKVLKQKAFAIASNPKYDEYQRGLASIVYKFFLARNQKELVSKNELDELHKPIIRKFKKRKGYCSIKDSIWGIDLADMQLISKYNKGIRYLLCAIDSFSKYAFFVSLKDKKGTTIANALQKILNNNLKRKPSKIWVDQDSEFQNNSSKKMLQENRIEMYSTHNEWKSVIAGRFIKTLKNKIYKHITDISKNVYFNVLNDIVDKCNNTYHKTIKMKPINIKK